MGLPSGSFSSLYPGLVWVSLSAEIWWSSSIYPRPPAGDLGLRVKVTDGVFVEYLPILNMASQSSSRLMMYPGSGVTWSVLVEVAYYSFASPTANGTMSAKNIQLVVELRKR